MLILLDTSAKMAARIANKLHLFHERDNKPNTRMKIASDIKLSQKNKKFLTNITGKGFRKVKSILNCYFYIKNIQTHLFNK